MQPMNTLPVPLPPNNSGGSYSTMFGSGSFTDGAANSLRSQGYNLKKSSNGSNVDKTTLINRFKENRSSSNQTAYRNDIELLRSLNYVTSKNPSRNTLEKSYVDFLTDFYSSDVNDLSEYVSQRLSR
jgi:hypothetical protein